MHGKSKLAHGRLHLTAAERLAVNAALDRAHNLLRVGRARRQERIRHARNGNATVIHSAAVAGGAHLHQAGREPVLQIPAQHPALDQHSGFLRDGALAVHVQRPAQARQGSVVHHRAQFCRNFLAQPVAEDRQLLAVGIGFQRVADRFVQQHAARTRRQHHRQLARGRVLGRQQHRRLRYCFPRQLLRVLDRESLQARPQPEIF